MLTGRHAARGSGRLNPASGAYPRIGALVLGGVAATLMGVVGCTSFTAGTARVDTEDVPVYRASVSASIAASSSQESQRQQSLTTQAVRSACVTLLTSSADAIDTTNKFVRAFNGGGDILAAAGPAKDSLNHSADAVAGTINDTLSPELRQTLNAWVDDARRVANAIGTHAAPSEFNSAVNQLNDTRGQGIRLCRRS